MKKQLLLGTALFAAIYAFPQQRSASPLSYGILCDRPTAKLDIEPVAKQQTTKTAPLTVAEAVFPQPQTSQAKGVQVSGTSTNWQLVSGSGNCYGMLSNIQKPLQYNDNLNIVSWLHRKSDTYVTSPSNVGNLGTVVAEISSNWGATWDSTCIWGDAINGGRYPNGAVYNPPGNTNIANAHIVCTGPIVGPQGSANQAFTGSYFTSKPINSFDNVAPGTPTAQYSPFTVANSFSALGWPRHGFTTNDINNYVRSMGILSTNPAGLTPVNGFGMLKGSFNSGSFTWTMDEIDISTAVATNTGGNVASEGSMAWNEKGDVGYMVFPGVLAVDYGSSMAMHPIAYKTTNYGTSWTQLPKFDLNHASTKIISDHLYATQWDTTLVVPSLNDFDLAVDSNNYLHIGAIFHSCPSSSVTPLDYANYYQTVNGGYKWGHSPGNRPYLYDLVTDGTGGANAWKVIVIDSLGSEGPDTRSGNGGYVQNPWAPVDATNNKIQVESRIQLGRTPTGNYITFSWAESDSSLVSGTIHYWNTIPDIHTRCMKIGNPACINESYLISKNEINVTSPKSGQGTVNTKVQQKATLHYMSPTSSAATVVPSTSGPTFTAELKMPFTVTHGDQTPPASFQATLNNSTWYSCAQLAFTFTIPYHYFCNTGISENSKNTLNSSLFPNPANNTANLMVDLTSNSKLEISISNLVGQTLKTVFVNGQSDSNIVALDLAGLNPGIYLVNVKAGNAIGTKKLVIQ